MAQIQAKNNPAPGKAKKAEDHGEQSDESEPSDPDSDPESSGPEIA